MEPEKLALVLAGILAPFVSQIIKWLVGQVGGELKDRVALWATFGLSVVLAAIVLTATGALNLSGGDPTTIVSALLEAAGLVFGVATLIYKSWKPA